MSQDLTDWTGRSETATDLLRPFPADALAATLDRDETYPEGVALPDLWHWLYFLPLHRLSESGRDGHAAKGGFLPPVPLPRRMWAGSRFRFLRPLTIGAEATKTSTIARVEPKQGRSGPLCFVTVSHDVRQDGQHCIAEEHDIVYREEAAPGAAPPATQPAPEASDFSRAIHPDPVLLFRYSALTFNGHRIHYDHPYVTGTEGYPGLVVHGPLIATEMVAAFVRAHPKARLTHLSYRGLRPLIAPRPFQAAGRLTEPGVAQLWAEQDGTLAHQAELRFSE